MINLDRKALEWASKQHLTDIAFSSKIIHERLTFKEHLELCSTIQKLSYKEVVELLVQEDIKEFEGRFKKFLKYGLAALIAIKAGVFKGFVGSILGAPAVGMFILYLFRKLTDTCSRECINKIPLSKKRKICILECKVDAVRKLTDQIRAEIVKCNQFANPEKCESKLRKQYIKWAKKLQELIIRLRQEKLGIEASERKARQRELDKERKRILKAGYEVERKEILNYIVESENLRKRLSFQTHLTLYKKVKTISESGMDNFFLEEEQPQVKPPSINPKKEQMFRRVIYLGLWVLPVPFFNDFINYLLKKYNYACLGKCLNKPKVNKDICYKQCRYISTKMSVDFLEKQLSSCDKHKKPVKCKKKILNLLKDWKQREADSQIKYEGALRKHGVV